MELSKAEREAGGVLDLDTKSYQLLLLMNQDT